MKNLFKENKNLNEYKKVLLEKYEHLGIAAVKMGVSVSSIINLFSGNNVSINCHIKIAEELKMPFDTYCTLLKDIYKDGVLENSKKLNKILEGIKNERIGISNEG